MFITQQAPRYPTAFRVGTSFAVIGGLATVLNTFLLARENRKLEQKEASEVNNTSTDSGFSSGVKFRNTL